ncbi:uncharacterized protein ARMOST_12838 [Armillaria ostoyae]|uniref:Uncharacterized protein n=1 Tax=Armillaria ostoyae TaxID=47428 RepID=A0A284RL30_ARMOS|nr:uncharacterized protein ARMOST_12838 [Armillaria ostoyae]
MLLSHARADAETRIASGQAWTESQRTPGVNTDLRQYFSMASSSHFHDSHRGTNMLYGYSRPYNSRTRSPVGYSMERASSRLNSTSYDAGINDFDAASLLFTD